MSALQHSPAGLADNAMVFQLRSFSHLHVAGTVVANSSLSTVALTLKGYQHELRYDRKH